MAGPVQSSADEAARQILAIGAQQGDAGVAAFNQASQQINQAQADALARGGMEAGQIAAPTTAASEMAQLYLRPTTTAQQLLAADKASFQSGIARSAYGDASYLNKLGAIEPVLDKYLAAKAAAAAGGGGGGGSGGGGGGGDKPLSDSALRTQLTGAATQARASDIQAATDALKASSQARTAARQGVKAAVGVRKGAIVQNVNQLRAVGKAAQKVKGKPNAAQRRVLNQRARSVISGLIGVNRTALAEAGARTAAQKAAQAQRSSYGGLVQSANAPLGDYARTIGVNAGEDPNRVYGLIGPTEDKSFLLADQARNAAAGGPLGQFGRPPTLGPIAAAKEIKVTPEKAKAMRASPNYRTLASSVEQALEKGVPFADVSRGLESWRQPVVQKHTKGSLKGQPVIKNGKPVLATPAHAHLVDLVLSDYAPAFQR